jgi:hypothetical protein
MRSAAHNNSWSAERLRAKAAMAPANSSTEAEGPAPSASFGDSMLPESHKPLTTLLRSGNGNVVIGRAALGRSQPNSAGNTARLAHPAPVLVRAHGRAAQRSCRRPRGAAPRSPFNARLQLLGGAALTQRVPADPLPVPTVSNVACAAWIRTRGRAVFRPRSASSATNSRTARGNARTRGAQRRAPLPRPIPARVAVTHALRRGRPGGRRTHLDHAVVRHAGPPRGGFPTRTRRTEPRATRRLSPPRSHRSCRRVRTRARGGRRSTLCPTSASNSVT